jgi:hypothetical protein
MKEIASLLCVSTTQITEFELQKKKCINLSNELALMQASDITLKSEISNQMIEILDKDKSLQDTVERMKTESESSREESQRLHTIQIGKCLLLIIMIEE